MKNLKKAFCICVSILCLIANGEEKKNEFEKIIEKHQKSPKDNFDSEIMYIEENVKGLSKEAHPQKAKILKILASKKPKTLIEWIKNGTLKEIDGPGSDSLLAYVITVFIENKNKEAVSILEELNVFQKDGKATKELAGEAADILSGNIAKEEFEKKTPQKSIISYAAYLDTVTDDEISDAEKEFWVYPKYYDYDWKRWKSLMQKQAEERQRILDGVKQAAQDIQQTNGENIKFIYTSLKDVVILEVNGKKIISLRKDKFGSWRFGGSQ